MNIQYPDTALREQVVGLLAAGEPQPAELVALLLMDLLRQVNLAATERYSVQPKLFPAWFLFGDQKDCSDVVVDTGTDDAAGFSEWDDFIPPEYFSRGVCEPASEVFAFGMIGYKLLMGAENPYPGESVVEVMENRSAGVFKPLTAHRADCPPSLVAPIERSLLANPEERFESLHELRLSLIKYIERLDDLEDELDDEVEDESEE